MLSIDNLVFDYRENLTFAVGLTKYHNLAISSGVMFTGEKNLSSSGHKSIMVLKYSQPRTKTSQKHDAVEIFELSCELFEIANLPHSLWNNLIF